LRTADRTRPPEPRGTPLCMRRGCVRHSRVHTHTCIDAAPASAHWRNVGRAHHHTFAYGSTRA
jgi:hypothetical protein